VKYAPGIGLDHDGGIAGICVIRVAQNDNKPDNQCEQQPKQKFPRFRT